LRAGHLGFLHGTHESFNGKNRWQRYVDQHGKAPSLPDLKAGEYLYETFIELGLAKEGNAALRPIDWSEIDAFMRCTGDIETPWEAKLIRRMSQEYVMQRTHGSDPFAEPFWDGS
jgi:hypothetical protein